jgi:phytoene synthase
VTAAPIAAAYAHCEALTRAQDPDRYYATLFAPAETRPALFALYAFSAEVARIRESVSDPMPGEIRLQWWRDAVIGQARGDASANPVAAALADAATRYGLPRQSFLDLIDAREFDLYDDPMPTTGDLEGYLAETSSSLIRLASLVLADGAVPGGSDAAAYGGIAIGITGLLRALPWHAHRGQLYLPRDVLERHGVTRDDVVLGRGGPGFLSALAEMRSMARHRLEQAVSELGRAEPAIRPALLPLALTRGYLGRMERPGYDPFRTVVDRPAWLKIAALWRASRG